MARFRDFDAALEQRGPLTFKLGGHGWTVPGMGMRAVAAVLSVMADDNPDTLEFVNALNAFFEAVVTEPDLWEAKTANIGVGTLKELLEWLVGEELGMAATPADEDADPLARLSASSSPSPANGRSPAGVSPGPASPTR